MATAPHTPVSRRKALLAWLKIHRPEVHARLSTKGAIKTLDTLFEGWKKAPRETTAKGDDPSFWSKNQRVAANMKALASFYTDQDPKILQDFSGWGGIKPSEISAALTMPDVVRGALEEWRKAEEEQRYPETILFRGMKDQFFTPRTACRAMWALAMRARGPHAGPIRSILEPSAGIGRFVQTAPADLPPGVQWTLVERDAFLAAFLAAIYPKAAIYGTRFEGFVAQALNAGASFDVVLENPPYGPWDSLAGQKLDPGMVQHASDIQTYFLKRSLDLTAPGGVMVAITTMGQMTGSKRENRNLRAFLMADAHFAGAAAIPVNLFEKLGAAPAAGLAIHVWVKLPEGARASLGYSEIDRAVLTGKYFETTAEGRASVLGEWGVGRFGDPVVKGEFSEEATAAVPIFPLPFVIPQTIQVQLPMPPKPEGLPSVVRTAIEAKARSVNAKISIPKRDPVEEVPLMEARLGAYYAAMQGGSQGIQLAIAGRQELLGDLTDLLQHFNPHAQGAISAPWMVRIVSQDGHIHPSLSQGQVAVEVPDKALRSPEEAVSWYSRMHGVCLEEDLAREYPTAVLLDTVLGTSNLAIELEPQIMGYAKADYLSGNLYHRLDLVDRALSSEGAPAGGPLADRLKEQRGWLTEAINPQTIVDVDVRPNSGFVPPECLAEFVRGNEEGHGGYCPPFTDGYGSSEPCVVKIWKDEFARYQLDASTALPTRNRRNGAQIDNRIEKLAFLMGYLNRELEVQNPDPNEIPKIRRYHSDDPTERLVEDKNLEETFKLWVAQNDAWRPQIEDAYNRAFRSDHIRDYPTDPFPLLRLSPQIRPHGHQWAGARRLQDRGAGLLNWSVGLGKTIGALTSISTLRQSQKITKGLIVCPNPVLTTWIREIAQTLPDYRVGLIGLTYDPSHWVTLPAGTQMPDGTVTTRETMVQGGYRPDAGRADERKAKWERFAAGGYDVLICTESAFLWDVAVRPESMLRTLSSVEWLLNSQGKSAEAKVLIERRIEEAKGEIVKRQQQILSEEAVLKRSPTRDDTKREIARLKKIIAETELKIVKWQEDLAKPSDTALGTIEEMIHDRVEANIFRPKDSNGEVLLTMVFWEDLGVDFMVVDEAHHFKNLFAPKSRVGVSKIAYMGSKRWSDKWADFTVKSWDMFCKTQYLSERTGGKGVLLLTATPVKNSPLEVFNIFAYISITLWTLRGVSSPEEWIDRYVTMETKTLPTSDSGLEEGLSVTKFTDENRINELNPLFNIWMYRLTTDDAVNMKLIRKDVLPNGREVKADVDLDPIQTQLYARVRQIINVEREIAKAADIPIPGGIILMRNDMYEKVALDPRILVHNLPEVEKRLITDELILAKAQKRKPETRLVISYPLPEDELDTEATQAIHEMLRAARIETEATIDMSKVKALPEDVEIDEDTGKKVKRPRRPMSEIERENLERRYLILLSLGLQKAQEYYTRHDPPKYVLLTQNVLKSARCGHLIFVENNLCQGYLVEILTRSGIDPARIKTLTGAVPPVERAQIAEDFNGVPKTEFHPATGKVLRVQREPLYDILIGNKVMSEGLNLQTRTCAIHHMDLPWEPATLQQRNGRGVRQGNTLAEVLVYYYVALRSLDTKRKDAILGKATWQESLLSGQTTGSIGFEEDWDTILIEELASTPEEAARLIEDARLKQATKTRDRLVAEVQREFRSLVALYHRARLAFDSKDQEIQAQIADQKADTLIPKFARLGYPATAIRDARSAPVYFTALTGFHLTEGEWVTLASDSTADGDWHRAPVTLQVAHVHPQGNYVMVRQHGSPADEIVQVSSEPVAPPSRLLSPRQVVPPRITGIVTRLPLATSAKKLSETEYQSLFDAVSSCLYNLGHVTPHGTFVDPQFRTSEWAQAVWQHVAASGKLAYGFLSTGNRHNTTWAVPFLATDMEGKPILYVGTYLGDSYSTPRGLIAGLKDTRLLASASPEDLATVQRLFAEHTAQRPRVFEVNTRNDGGAALPGNTLYRHPVKVRVDLDGLAGSLALLWFGVTKVTLLPPPAPGAGGGRSVPR